MGRTGALPLHRLVERLELLGVDAAGYEARTGLPQVPEPDRLALAGFDRYQRALWLAPGAANGWARMRIAAQRDGVALEAISGYRSHDYQLGIFERKLARGQAVPEILQVNAAPGYSEHHSWRWISARRASLRRRKRSNRRRRLRGCVKTRAHTGSR